MSRRNLILRTVAQHKEVTQRRLVELLGVDPRAHLLKLKSDRLIRGVEVKGVMGYSVTMEGRLELGALDMEAA